MKIKTQSLALVVLVFIFGTVAATSALDLWKTTTSKIPAKYTEGEFAGQYNPADIRGSYTFEAINDSFQIPVEDLGHAFGLKDPAQFAAFQVKNLETMYAELAAEGKEVGTDSVRLFVALYKGLPTTLLESTSLPKPAVELLKAKAPLTPAQTDLITKNSVEIPASTFSAETPIEVVENPSEDAFDGIIKGKTTFKDLLDWGVQKEDMEKVLQDSLPNSAKLLKDYATDKGIEFSTIKGSLQELVDKVNK